jgi:serine phosphatase RsbU (regulator of sigma subunit)
LLYTDGLLEAADLRGAFFGDARLFDSLRKTREWLSYRRR